MEALQHAISSVLLNSQVPAASCITVENTGPLLQTEFFLIAGAEKKGATVQGIMKKGVTIHDYYSVIPGHRVG